jgi:hypothetical protein
MVLSLAQAIAKGQTALDTASLNTLKVLASTTFDYIPDITEVIEPGPTISAGGTEVTGVDVSTTTATHHAAVYHGERTRHPADGHIQRVMARTGPGGR